MRIMALILSIVCVYILIHTYHYLKEVEQCECFKKDDVKYGVNIQYMKLFQILHIILFVLYVLWSVFGHPMTESKMFHRYVTTQILVLLLFVYGYMFYNILNFYRNVKKDCKCVDKSYYKYFIYFEGISSFMSFLQIAYSFLLVIIIVALNLIKKQ